MKRVMLIVAYEGTAYHGWQVQPNGVTIESVLNQALSELLDEDIAAQEHMLEGYPTLRAQYQPGDGNTEVYYLKDATAQICSFTEPAKIITF